MGRLRVVLDSDADEKICTMDGTLAALDRKAEEIAARANAIGSSFRTGRYYDREAEELRGNTQPEYGAVKARKVGKSAVALVHNENYAGYRDCVLHNTLLKAKG